MATDKTTQTKDPAITSGPARTKGWMPNTLSWLTKGWRGVSLGSPLVGALEMGALGWWLGKKYGHTIPRLLSPRSFRGVAPDEYDHAARREMGNTAAWTLGILAPLAVLAANYQPNAPGKGLLTYSPMSKDGSAFGSLTLDDGRALIMGNSELTDTQKMLSMNLLNTFNAPPSATITGADLVGQAIATGQSAATGMAIGYLTANILGLPNPKSTAILGAVANTLGPRAALIGSTIFGQ